MSLSPLRILVDLTRLRPGGEGGGIKPALREIFRQLQSPPSRFCFIFVTAPHLAGELQEWCEGSSRMIVAERPAPELAAKEKCDVVYCPFGTTDWACPGIPTVTLVVDLLHRDFPESLTFAEQRYREEYFARAVTQTDVFQVISDFTARRLMRHYPSAAGCVRTYLPIHTRLSRPTENPAHIATPYFFYPANGWIHKNHETLLLAYSLYRQQAASPVWRLVLTGHWGDGLTRLQEIVGTLELNSLVDFRGYVTDAALAGLWEQSSALVFPSLHEGFGIPLVEAMAWSKPILASNVSSVPEIVGAAALQVDARNPLRLAEGLFRISQDAALRNALVDAGKKRLRQFSFANEVDILAAAFGRTAACSTRYRRSGYHEIDGLIEPTALFALPKGENAMLAFTTLPLGISRTLEFWTDGTLTHVQGVPADATVHGEIAIPHVARSLMLRVPDATRLSPSDPRTHGAILGRLEVRSRSGKVIDLLKGTHS